MSSDESRFSLFPASYTCSFLCLEHCYFRLLPLTPNNFSVQFQFLFLFFGLFSFIFLNIFLISFRCFSLNVIYSGISSLPPHSTTPSPSKIRLSASLVCLHSNHMLQQLPYHRTFHALLKLFFVISLDRLLSSVRVEDISSLTFYAKHLAYRSHRNS